MNDILSAIDELWWPKGHFSKEQRNFFVDLLSKKRPARTLEIGFAGGRSCATTILSAQPEKIVSVDANLDYAGGREMSEKLTGRFPQLKVVEGRSQDVLCKEFFVQEFEGKGIDFAFVDGCHLYSSAKKDCESCWAALNPGGVMVVDDFESGPPGGWNFPTVNKAVCDFAKSMGLTFQVWKNGGKGMAIFQKEKPLLRWTIGDVSPYGFETLAVSVSKAKSIYGDEFDYIICHNHLSEQQLSVVSGMGVPMYEQKIECCGLNIDPGKTNSWKLFPPRLRMSSHEIFLDNDVILHDRVPEIEDFLRERRPIALQGGRKSPAYGRFESMVPKNLTICSAIFGYPPGFDAESKLSSMVKERILPEQFDEQGMVAAVFASSEGMLIPEERISNCWSGYVEGKFGVHFAGVNYGQTKPWRRYKMKMGMYI